MSERDLIAVIWDGETFRPETGFMRRRADERFGKGEIILIAAEEERSMRQHRFFFAQLADLWRTLPERYALEPWAQSAEALRRYLLIRAGYRHSQTYLCESKAEAGRLAMALRPLDAFALVVVQSANVVRLTAESQSIKAMGRERFKASADAVLSLAETLVTGGELPGLGEAA